MPTTIYDSSLITQRKRAVAQSGSFIGRISPWNVKGLSSTVPAYPVDINANTQPNTGYAPALGIWDQSVINTVKNGQMSFYRKNDGGCTTVSAGCPCLPLPTTTAQTR